MCKFYHHIKPVLQQIRLLTGLNVAGKTRNIAFELVLQQKLQNKLNLFVARFTEALAVRAKIVLHLLFFSGFETSYWIEFFSIQAKGGSQWGGRFYDYRLKFWLFYSYRLIFFSVTVNNKVKN